MAKLTIHEIERTIDTLLPDLISFRQDLHRHPELSWQEYRTTTQIETKLKEFGYSQFHRPLKTGGWVEYMSDASRNASFIMLRADIDALPIQDMKDVPYRSENEGVCHACGHDVHTTIVLGVAGVIKKLSPALSRNIRFVFQPAEEPIPSGAPKLIETGVLNRVKYALGMHVEPKLPVDTVSLTPGWVNMQSNHLEITLLGPGGHSARPFESADLIWLASEIVSHSYQLVNRKANLIDHPIVLTFTEIEAGDGYNVLPKALKLTGTLRTADLKEKNKLLRHIRKHLRHLENLHTVSITMDIREGAPPVHNDENLIRLLQGNLQNSAAPKFKLSPPYRSPGGDDFGYYAAKVPAAMIRFGIRKGKLAAMLHTGYFDVPNQVIRNAIRFFVYQILNL